MAAFIRGQCWGLPFLIYMNFVAANTNITYKCKIFADNLKIYIKINITSSAQPNLSTMQRDMTFLVSRAESWELMINADKIVALRLSYDIEPTAGTCYHMKGSPIQFLTLPLTSECCFILLLNFISTFTVLPTRLLHYFQLFEKHT